MKDINTSGDLFDHTLLEESKSIKVPRKRSPQYRTADLICNKYDILKELSYTHDTLPIPIMEAVTLESIPKKAITFSKALTSHDHTQLVHFYEADRSFARVLHNPKKYLEILRKFQLVVAPDFSQKIGYQPFICYVNSWWNKALGAYFQINGITTIPNVSWSDPYSYHYAFAGIPQKSVIAINSTGIISNPASIYLWRKGYEEAIRLLEPTLILRYGDRIPGEYEDISVYYENTNLNNLRNGSKRIIC